MVWIHYAHTVPRGIVGFRNRCPSKKSKWYQFDRDHVHRLPWTETFIAEIDTCGPWSFWSRAVQPFRTTGRIAPLGQSTCDQMDGSGDDICMEYGNVTRYRNILGTGIKYYSGWWGLSEVLEYVFVERRQKCIGSIFGKGGGGGPPKNQWVWTWRPPKE